MNLFTLALAFLLQAPSGAPAAPPPEATALTDSEARVVFSLQLEQNQYEAEMQVLQAKLNAVNTKIQTKMTELQTKYNCTSCRLDLAGRWHRPEVPAILKPPEKKP
jgi:Skp family chaperone for outer membrane proteins